ncbi:hypothetical protein AAT19DRAFT_14432 [Rhodotorula toruloides]|uniref:Uncharacterized protein n=1 Tax=Rhodotorula toruloides TaxID=5286 RepID=A0A2T0ABN7_RHOTO|nr:hypothetical protein AAT19DRAFT_14432 [Rhodotorula toruloides]
MSPLVAISLASIAFQRLWLVLLIPARSREVSPKPIRSLSLAGLLAARLDLDADSLARAARPASPQPAHLARISSSLEPCLDDLNGRPRGKGSSAGMADSSDSSDEEFEFRDPVTGEVVPPRSTLPTSSSNGFKSAAPPSSSTARRPTTVGAWATPSHSQPRAGPSGSQRGRLVGGSCSVQAQGQPRRQSAGGGNERPQSDGAVVDASVSNGFTKRATSVISLGDTSDESAGEAKAAGRDQVTSGRRQQAATPSANGNVAAAQSSSSRLEPANHQQAASSEDELAIRSSSARRPSHVLKRPRQSSPAAPTIRTNGPDAAATARMARTTTPARRRHTRQTRLGDGPTLRSRLLQRAESRDEHRTQRLAPDLPRHRLMRQLNRDRPRRIRQHPAGGSRRRRPARHRQQYHLPTISPRVSPLLEQLRLRRARSSSRNRFIQLLLQPPVPLATITPHLGKNLSDLSSVLLLLPHLRLQQLLAPLATMRARRTTISYPSTVDPISRTGNPQRRLKLARLKPLHERRTRATTPTLRSSRKCLLSPPSETPHPLRKVSPEASLQGRQHHNEPLNQRTHGRLPLFRVTSGISASPAARAQKQEKWATSSRCRPVSSLTRRTTRTTRTSGTKCRCDVRTVVSFPTRTRKAPDPPPQRSVGRPPHPARTSRSTGTQRQDQP